jgi:hypothetical protein
MPTLATTALVTVTGGSIGYAKGYLDGAEYHRCYVETERKWRLLWDKYMVFLRQLVTGRMRSESAEYSASILQRLQGCVGDMLEPLASTFTKEKSSRFIASLSAYARIVDAFLAEVATDRVAFEESAKLTVAVEEVVENLCRINIKLFNVEEVRALFRDKTENLIRIIGHESQFEYESSLKRFTTMQETSGEFATLFALAANRHERPITCWI